MAESPDRQLSRRERQIMDSLYRRGQATVMEILEDLPEPPTDSAVRAMLRLLEAKGQVRRCNSGRPQVYAPTLARDEAGIGAVRHLLRTFFGGSRERAIQAVLASSDVALGDDELDRLMSLIEDTKEQGGAS
jgi:predicted transcriptional regulator